MLTNLDILKRHFKKANFNELDEYSLTNEFTIAHIEGEIFCVDIHSYDRDVGYTSNPEIFSGDLIQCLDYVLKCNGMDATTEQDKLDYKNIISNLN